MHVNNWTVPTPSQEVLDKCHQVFVSDPVTPMWQMRKFCRSSDLSLVWSELVDTSDVSGSIHDEIAAFYFIEEKDATLFSLKYK